jgi:hypothetical protein
MLKKGFFIIFVLSFFVWAFFVWEQNYKKHLQIRSEFVEHPENLPKPEVANRTTFGFSNVIADKYWLQAIQYIWGNAIDSAYKKYLFAILDIITTLNPFFDHPYIIGMLLLPGHNDIYENLWEEAQARYTDQWLEIWLKWIENFCDMEKIDLIDKEFDLQKIWNDEAYRNPCKNDMIPFSLAFVYYFYKNQPLEAAKYYKVASAIDDSLEWAKIMSAIMQWKWGDREKSIYMFLNMWKTIEPGDEACGSLSSELENIMNGLSSGQFVLSGKLIQDIGKAREQVFWEFNEETKEIAMSDTSCQNYVNKATRELNLLYLDLANKAFKEANDGQSAKNGKELLEAWFIDIDPVDFQQYEDYGVRYEYNDKVGNFDYFTGQ